MGDALKSGSGDFLRVGEVFAGTNPFASVDDGRSHHTYQDGLPRFCAGRGCRRAFKPPPPSISGSSPGATPT
jgi:hypothetical protein